jgi:hypothetical protein
MTVLNAEAGTSKPDERFQLHLENDISATFLSDPPSPMELFSVILKCGTSTKYLTSMDEITGSPFETVTNVKIQMIGMETPSQGPPEMLIPSSSPGEGEGDGEGDEEDVPGPSDLTQALVEDVNLMDYLVKYVWKIEDSAFANTCPGIFSRESVLRRTY